MSDDKSALSRANNIQSFRCKVRPLRPRKRPQRSISRTSYANNRWLRRPGPWPGAGAVTARAVVDSLHGRNLKFRLRKGSNEWRCFLIASGCTLKFLASILEPEANWAGFHDCGDKSLPKKNVSRSTGYRCPKAVWCRFWKQIHLKREFPARKLVKRGTSSCKALQAFEFFINAIQNLQVLSDRPCIRHLLKLYRCIIITADFLLLLLIQVLKYKGLQLGLWQCLEACLTMRAGRYQEFWKWQKFGRNPACISSPFTPEAIFWILIFEHSIRRV